MYVRVGGRPQCGGKGGGAQGFTVIRVNPCYCSYLSGTYDARGGGEGARGARGYGAITMYRGIIEGHVIAIEIIGEGGDQVKSPSHHLWWRRGFLIYILPLISVANLFTPGKGSTTIHQGSSCAGESTHNLVK